MSETKIAVAPAAPEAPAVTAGAQIQYTGFDGIAHVAICTRVYADGTVALVAFATIHGDEPCDFVDHVRWNASVKSGNTWRHVAGAA